MNNKVIDLNDVLERVQDDWELLLELFEIFENDFAVKRLALEEGMSQKNFDKIRDLAHSLKGASGNISARSLFQAFYQLEKMGESKNLTRMGEVLKTVDTQFVEFKACAEQIKKDYQKQRKG